MNQSIMSFLSETKQKVDNRLSQLIEPLNIPENLKASMIYSLQAGGKRLRPILLLAVIEALGKDSEVGLDAACSLEMLHTYSLIHDDLPAMDDDDLRRGRPTNHIVYGEATAILAGDALLTHSFSCLAQAEGLDPLIRLELTRELAQAAGPEGMVGGQMSDLEAEGVTIALPDLESIHARKTGKLLAYSVKAGAIIARADHDQTTYLERFADHLGMAFQIKDDILDVEGESSIIGKPAGSDEERDKNTYPSLLTLDGAKAAMALHFDGAIEALKKANVDGTVLEGLTRYTIERNN